MMLLCRLSLVAALCTSALSLQAEHAEAGHAQAQHPGNSNDDASPSTTTLIEKGIFPPGLEYNNADKLLVDAVVDEVVKELEETHIMSSPEAISFKPENIVELTQPHTIGEVGQSRHTVNSETSHHTVNPETSHHRAPPGTVSTMLHDSNPLDSFHFKFTLFGGGRVCQVSVMQAPFIRKSFCEISCPGEPDVVLDSVADLSTLRRVFGINVTNTNTTNTASLTAHHCQADITKTITRVVVKTEVTTRSNIVVPASTSTGYPISLVVLPEIRSESFRDFLHYADKVKDVSGVNHPIDLVHTELSTIEDLSTPAEWREIVYLASQLQSQRDGINSTQSVKMAFAWLWQRKKIARALHDHHTTLMEVPQTTIESVSSQTTTKPHQPCDEIDDGQIHDCMQRFHGKLDIVTVFKAAMYDNGTQIPNAFGWFTHYTRLEGDHWGTSVANLTYWPAITTTTVKGTETRPTVIRQTPPFPLDHSSRQKDHKLAGDPHCWDRKTCCKACKKDPSSSEDRSFWHGPWKWVAVAVLTLFGLAVLSALVLTCCKHRRRRPANEEKFLGPRSILRHDPTRVVGANQTAATGNVMNPPIVFDKVGQEADGLANARGTLGRQAEEGRARVNFDESTTQDPDKSILTPSGPNIEVIEERAGDEVKDRPSGVEVVDQGSLRDRKKSQRSASNLFANASPVN